MNRAAVTPTEHPSGDGLVEIDGAGFYAITDVAQMPPFLMSVVSDGDRWMFISSTGALTAGRVDSSGALFRYETDDRLHDAAGIVGPVTAIHLHGESADEVWMPFSTDARKPVGRNLYKSVVGDSIVFEENHPNLPLRFRYRWASSDRFGFVRTATLTNEATDPVQLELIDGLLRILPHGLDPTLYESKSNLTNAYKRSEILDERTRLAVFSLESKVVDRPEPAESLRATTAWSTGLPKASLSISSDALTSFLDGHDAAGQTLLTGRPGSYLLSSAVELDPGSQIAWHIVADVARDQIDVAALQHLLRSEIDLEAQISTSLKDATRSLVDIMAPADAQQRTGDRVATAHQFSNVTFNVMRGGVPLSGYTIATDDFTRFVHTRNHDVAARHRTWLDSLPAVIERNVLLDHIEKTGDVNFVRLGLEYLPFSFSRRHGDPSRPWNAFSIRVRDTTGNPINYYEGNWRDIFQNWEALCGSFPEYLPGVISVFVNASTPDGFNPYRITRDGIDWEVPDPDDPWSNIGYWGDHQIVYLLRLLQAADRFLPGRVSGLLCERQFTYADVPYRLAPYSELVRDPKATISYDEAAAARSSSRVDRVGSDGRLLWNRDGGIHHVTLIEKLLVAALSKLSNFVPGGGIWMNTQRPEWNDANNALVGFGLSMVTLSYLRKYLSHFNSLLRTADIDEVTISSEVADWLAAVTGSLRRSPTSHNDQTRRALVDELGAAFSDYRARIYNGGFTGTAIAPLDDLLGLCETAIEHLDQTIRGSKRADGLYHSYNLIHFSPDEASLEHMYEMLEGQVAALESGVLSADERADLIDSLFASAIYREDQRSFMLYPARSLPPFLEKNVVPAEAVKSNPLLVALLNDGDHSLIEADIDGVFRFNSDFTNRDELEGNLDRLSDNEKWKALVTANRTATLAAYEDVFDHHAYTGRSGSMYGYEGIGSIYWHMVAKLLVAVQDSTLAAVADGAPAETVERLVANYWRVRAGLGFNKSAREFGAIPIDAYSHTPAHAGAQQPGMTGLVKEELLTRSLEVGVRVEDGEIRFDPRFVRREELLEQKEPWQLLDIGLQPAEIELGQGSLGLTLCQVPIVVSVAGTEAGIDVSFANGATESYPGLRLDRSTSAKVFARSGEITRISAQVPGN
jgi:hypothetical protein